MSESNKLSIILHHNNEITVRDERGYPAVCLDCRFSGWRNAGSYRSDSEPRRCLHHSGGADPVDGDRILNRLKDGGSYVGNNWTDHWDPRGEYGRAYPLCKNKNPAGKCDDFVRAKTLPWRGNFWRKLLGREWRSKKMRL